MNFTKHLAYNPVAVFLALMLVAGGLTGCAGGDTATVTINVGLDNFARAHTPTIFDRFLAFISMSSTLQADPPSPQYGLTSIELTISGVGMQSIRRTIPLDTGELTLDIASGPARMFTVVAYSESSPSYGGIAAKDLSPGASETITIQMGLLPYPPETINLNAGQGNPSGVELNWSYSFLEPEGLLGFKIYRSDNLEGGPYYLISSRTRDFYYDGEIFIYTDVGGTWGNPLTVASWYKISAKNQFGEGYLTVGFANGW